MVAASVGPPMVVAAFWVSVWRAQVQLPYGGPGQWAAICARAASSRTGRIAGSEGSAKAEVGVFCPVTDRN